MSPLIGGPGAGGGGGAGALGGGARPTVTGQGRASRAAQASRGAEFADCQVVLHGSQAGDDAGMWNRYEVAVPTLLIPYQDDSLNGNGLMGALRISASRSNPITLEQGFSDAAFSVEQSRQPYPCGARGCCWLWSPGTWWIRIQTTEAGYGPFNLGFHVIPDPDETALSILMFDRHPQRSPCNAKIVSTTNATMLRAVETMNLLSLTIQARLSNVGTFIRIAWEEDVSMATHARWIRLSDNEILTFAGPTLPLADLIAATNNNTGTRQLKLFQYR